MHEKEYQLLSSITMEELVEWIVEDFSEFQTEGLTPLQSISKILVEYDSITKIPKNFSIVIASLKELTKQLKLEHESVEKRYLKSEPLDKETFAYIQEKMKDKFK